jgi:hypothetical protein
MLFLCNESRPMATCSCCTIISDNCCPASPLRTSCKLCLCCLVTHMPLLVQQDRTPQFTRSSSSIPQLSSSTSHPSASVQRSHLSHSFYITDPPECRHTPLTTHQGAVLKANNLGSLYYRRGEEMIGQAKDKVHAPPSLLPSPCFLLPAPCSLLILCSCFCSS